MTKSKYNILLKKMINENALDYLNKKKGTKGKEITYKNSKAIHQHINSMLR